MHKKTILDLLDSITESIGIIRRGFANTKKPDDFYANDENIDKFDAICMRLQSIGEAIKSINKKRQRLLERHYKDEGDHFSSLY